MNEFRVYFKCPRHGYTIIIAQDEAEATEKAEEMLNTNDFEEAITIDNPFGEWYITQVEEV